MPVEDQNKRQMRCGIIPSDDMRLLFVGTNMTKEVTSLDEDLGQMGLLNRPYPYLGQMGLLKTLIVCTRGKKQRLLCVNSGLVHLRAGSV